VEDLDAMIGCPVVESFVHRVREQGKRQRIEHMKGRGLKYPMCIGMQSGTKAPSQSSRVFRFEFLPSPTNSKVWDGTGMSGYTPWKNEHVGPYRVESMCTVYLGQTEDGHMCVPQADWGCTREGCVKV